MTALKLSICIATLNRGAFIGQTLESIITQATDEVEVVVVDGASTDNTPEVVGAWQKKFPYLNYVRLAQKGGVDADYNRTVELARGEYCWLMSDDDLLKPGAIAAVLQAIEKNYDSIVVNAEVRSNDFAQSIVPALLSPETDRVYTPADVNRLLVDTATFMTFIGCVVIRREVWLERERERYFGTEFIHVGVIFQKPLTHNALIIAHPWIAIRYGNASWSSRYFQIWTMKWPQIIWSFPNFSDEIKRQVCPREPWRMPKILMILRAKGTYSMREYNNFISPRPVSRREKIIAQTIARLPGCWVNAFVLLYFSRFRAQQLYGLAEFRSSPFYYKNCFRKA